MKKPDLSPRFFRIAAIAIFLIAAALRFWSLPSINEKIFDEVYFPVFANNYLTHTDFFDVHPPLGKLIIASSISILGNNPLGWRITQAIVGTLLVAVVMGFTYDLTKRKLAALLAGFLVLIDPMALVESRVGLINIFLAFFSIAGLWFFWRWWTDSKQKIGNFLASVVFLTLAISVKWIGAGAMAAVIIFLLVQKLRFHKQIHLDRRNYIALLLIPFLYIASFIPDMLRGQEVLWWHTNAFQYHVNLTATHPYGSEWWSWPIMLRPIWLYYKLNPAGQVMGIIEIGNIVTWVAGLGVILYIIHALYLGLHKKEPYYQPILFLSITYLTLYLPWIFIGRVKFIYHYFVPALILLPLLAIVLEDRVLTNPKYRLYGFLFLALATAFFIYFLPLLMGHPINQSNYQQHMWLKSWI